MTREIVIFSTERMKRKKKNVRLKILKAITGMLCLVGFFFNSFIIFKQFIENETVTSSKLQKNSKLFLPSVTICGFNGYKRVAQSYSDFSMENYINNTIGLNEILLGKMDHDDTNDTIAKWKITTTYSAYRGRCYTIEYIKQVFHYSTFIFRISSIE